MLHFNLFFKNFLDSFFFNINFLFFFLCLFICCISLIIILAKNPMHSIFSLILTFCFIVIILIAYLQCEFLSIIFLIVYVGAISILFLFIVMLLNIRNIELTDKIFNYFPISFFIIFLFLILLNFLIKKEFYFVFTSLDMYYMYIDFLNNIDFVFEMTLLAFMLYEEYYFIFLLSAILLFVAMLGAILLTLQSINNTRKQLIYSQVYRHVFLKIFKNYK